MRLRSGNRDGAGILIQIPDKFFRRECAKLGFTLPPAGEYGVGMVFLPVEHTQRLVCEGILERIVEEEGLTVLGWRDTPINGEAIGRVARASQPYIEQIFVRCAPGMDGHVERKLYMVMKRAEAEVLASPKSRTRASSISPRCLHERSFIRACCSRRRSRNSIRNWPIRMR